MSSTAQFHPSTSTALCNRRAEFVTPEACIHCFWNPQNKSLRVAYRTSKDCARANVTLTNIEPPQTEEPTPDPFIDTFERLAHAVERMRAEGYSQEAIDAFGRGFILFLK